MDQHSWRIIQDSLGDGTLNMITDRAILMACNEGKVPATLRLYGWQRPTLSIGYSQEISQCIDLENEIIYLWFVVSLAAEHYCTNTR